MEKRTILRLCKLGEMLSIIGMLLTIGALTSTIIPRQESSEATNTVRCEEITLDDVLEHPMTLSDEFAVTEYGEDEVMITDYTGSDPIVVVPNEIGGKSVRGVKLSIGTEICGLKCLDLVCIYEWDSHKSSVHIYDISTEE